MKCPVCGAADSRVLDSRPIDDDKSIKRRRECPACLKRFTTYEVIDSVPLSVIKKSGEREFFDKHKLEAGIVKACYKRPVDAAKVAEDIETELTNSLLTEITTREIGEMVMERLRSIDEVSYVRFASVYREFKDIDTFISEINKVLRDRK
ncbi:MAG: transcriptional regulator NrdR [Eubacteriales bacterium]|nr:transcriptional regulator NrdR [Eubacteriales bacterium]